MAMVLKVIKQGNGLYLGLPMKMCRQEKIRHGDYFEIEKDILSPTYSLKKIGNDNGNIEKSRY